MKSCVDVNRSGKLSTSKPLFPPDLEAGVQGGQAIVISRSGQIVDPDNYSSIFPYDSMSVVFINSMEGEDNVIARIGRYGVVTAMSEEFTDPSSGKRGCSLRVAQSRFTSLRTTDQSSWEQGTITINAQILRGSEFVGKGLIIIPDYVGSIADVTYQWSLMGVDTIPTELALATLRCVSSMHITETITSDLNHDSTVAVRTAADMIVRQPFADDMLSAVVEARTGTKRPYTEYQTVSPFDIPIAVNPSDPVSDLYWIGLYKAPGAGKFSMNFFSSKAETTPLDKLTNSGVMLWAGRNFAIQ